MHDTIVSCAGDALPAIGSRAIVGQQQWDRFGDGGRAECPIFLVHGERGIGMVVDRLFPGGSCCLQIENRHSSIIWPSGIWVDAIHSSIMA